MCVCVCERVFPPSPREPGREWEPRPQYATGRVHAGRPRGETVEGLPSPLSALLHRPQVQHHNGHVFASYQVSIPQSCEQCLSYIWLMDKALLCSGECPKPPHPLTLSPLPLTLHFVSPPTLHTTPPDPPTAAPDPSPCPRTLHNIFGSPAAPPDPHLALGPSYQAP